MKLSLPLLLLLPLHAAFAQMRPTYSAPRPGYTPAPLYHPSTSTYQTQQRTQQQAHQTFQQMQSQQRQQMQDRYYYNRSQPYGLPHRQLAQRHRLSPEQQQQDLARQQQAEQKATEQITQLTQAQQRRRQEHPAADAQQAAAQQLADTKQMKVLTVKTYREVFLPGQLLSIQQSLQPTSGAKQLLQAVNSDLLDNAWWGKEPMQVPTKVAAYGNTLATLTTGLLGFDLASPALPPTPLAVATLDELLAKDAFDRSVAAQLLQTAAQSEKRLTGARLAQAVKEFQDLSAQVGATKQPSQSVKRQRKEIQKSLLRVNKELARYSTQVGNSGSLDQAQEAILKATTGYLAKSGG